MNQEQFNGLIYTYPEANKSLSNKPLLQLISKEGAEVIQLNRLDNDNEPA